MRFLTLHETLISYCFLVGWPRSRSSSREGIVLFSRFNSALARSKSGAGIDRLVRSRLLADSAGKIRPRTHKTRKQQDVRGPAAQHPAAYRRYQKPASSRREDTIHLLQKFAILTSFNLETSRTDINAVIPITKQQIYTLQQK